MQILSGVELVCMLRKLTAPSVKAFTPHILYMVNTFSLASESGCLPLLYRAGPLSCSPLTSAERQGPYRGCTIEAGCFHQHISGPDSLPSCTEEAMSHLWHWQTKNTMVSILVYATWPRQASLHDPCCLMHGL